MKLIAAAIAAAAFAFSPAALAQTDRPSAHHRGPDVAAQRAAMERISGMAGDWQGVANVTFPTAITVHQSEHVESEMNGLLLVIRGRGFAGADRSGAPIFNAFGVISYDDARQVYEFRVYNDGRAATAEARFLDDGRLQWVMNFAPVIIRYTIELENDTWREVGEMSRDNGATWTQTIEMNLTRVR